MAEAKLQVQLELQDKATRKFNKSFKQMEKSTSTFTSNFKKNWLAITAVIAGATLALRGLIRQIAGVIRVSAQFEVWAIQMESFTSSAAEARDVLEQMIQFSQKTPFTPEQVIRAGTLLKPLEELGFELEDLLTAAGNVASAFPVGFEEAALNLTKAFTAGIGAAELFRDRGVRSFIEVRQGIDLTSLSLKELRTTLLKSFLTGAIGAATEKASKTLEGRMSTLSGAITDLKRAIGDDFLPATKQMTERLIILTEAMTEQVEEGKVFDQFTEKVFAMAGAMTQFREVTDQALLTGIRFGEEVTHKFLPPQGISPEELAFNQAAQAELAAQERNKGPEGAPQAPQILEEFKKQFQEAFDELPTITEASISVITKQIDSLSKGVGNSFAQMIVFGKDFGASMKLVFQQMAVQFISSITEMIVQWILFQTISKALQAAQVASAAAFAASLTSIWAVPATLASIATGGGAAAAGSAAVAASIASTQALALGSQAIPGAADGGVVRSAGSVLVGERGPELLSLPRGAEVDPLTGAGGVSVNIENASFRGDQDVEDVFEEISSMLEENKRSKI